MLSKPALLWISQCPHFPCLSWTATSFLHLSLLCTHTLSWARQNPVFLRARGKETGQFLVYAAVSSYGISDPALGLNAIEQP